MNLSTNKLTKISLVILLISVLLSLMGFNDVFNINITSTPFSQYLLSPGGLLLSILMLILFLSELQNESQIIL